MYSTMKKNSNELFVDQKVLGFFFFRLFSFAFAGDKSSLLFTDCFHLLEKEAIALWEEVSLSLLSTFLQIFHAFLCFHRITERAELIERDLCVCFVLWLSIYFKKSILHALNVLSFRNLSHDY